MKWLLQAMIIGVVLAQRAIGQGHVSFDNFASALAPVTINALPGASNPAAGPAGAFVGSNYTASLFWLNGTITNQALFNSSNPIWVKDVLFFGTTGTGPSHGFDGDGSGFFDTGQVVLVPQTDFNVTLRVRAWYNGGGVYMSYAQAQAAGHNVGESNLLPLYMTAPPGPAQNLDGFAVHGRYS
jgi:hypothetical protein